MTTRDWDPLYNEAIVIEGSESMESYDHFWRYREGGVTVLAGSVYPVYGYLPETIRAITKWYNFIDQDTRFMEILTLEDIYLAKRSSKLGIILSLLDISDIQANLSLLKVYYRLGIRRIQPCYNGTNSIGSGSGETRDSGLSVLGEKIIKEMNKLGILIDLSHSGVRTSMEAMEITKKPVVFSHSNSSTVYNAARNVNDEQAMRAAQTGGLIGVTGFPAFISKSNHPKVAAMLNHLDYLVSLVGIDHVGLGIDYFWMQETFCSINEAMRGYNYRIENGLWSKNTYPPPYYYYPEEIRSPELYANIVPALRSRGYAESDIKKILGENYLRVLSEVWQ